MTNFGDSSGFIMISTTFTSSGTSAIPGGDIIYFWCPDVSGPYKSLQKIKQQAGGYSQANKDGKRDWRVELKDCYVVKNTRSKNTDEFNLILNEFEKMNKPQGAKRYLFVKNEADGVYLYLGNNATCTAQTSYMIGYATSYPWKMLSGNVYKFDITWQEALI